VASNHFKYLTDVPKRIATGRVAKKRYSAVSSAAAVIRRRPNICASSFCTSIPKVVSPK